MVQTPVKPPTESRICYSGLTWEQFELIRQGFGERPGVRLAYYAGTIEIFMPGQDHEIFSHAIGWMLTAFLLYKGILFFPTSAADQIKPGIAFTQADQSYCIGSRKPIPDLAIEIIFTSGSTQKLQRYQALGVSEVWFWEDGTLQLFHLTQSGYVKIDRSQLEGLQDLNLDLLKRCIMQAETDPSEAMHLFQKSLA
jgi:Uma2 family endonuclease